MESRGVRQVRPCYSCIHDRDGYCSFDPAMEIRSKRESLFAMRIKGVPPEKRESEGMNVDATVTKEIPCIYHCTVSEMKEISENYA